MEEQRPLGTLLRFLKPTDNTAHRGGSHNDKRLEEESAARNNL